MDIPHFCMALGSSRQTMASRAKVVAPAAPGSPVAVQPQPHPSIAARSKGNIAALQTPGGASGTDASVVNQGTALDEVGGTNQQTPSNPERHTANSFLVESDSKQSEETQASNDFLAGFHDKYDTAGSTTASLPAAPKTEQDAAREDGEPQQDDFD